MSTRRLLLRADAGFRTGSGHASRLLALSSAWTGAGGHAAFLSVNPSRALRARASEAGAEVVELIAAHPDPADLSAVKGAIADAGEAPWIAVDGYGFDAAYYGAIQESGARVLAVDDGPRLAAYPADAFLDQNAGAEVREYPLQPHTLALLGPRWALLRAEFAAASRARPTPAAAARLLISFGGSDPDDVTGMALRALRHVTPPLETVVVIGPDNPRADALTRSAAGLPVRVETGADMVALMAWADIGLVSGGVTMLEACAAGLPSLVAMIAGNQESGAEALARRGAVHLLGPAARLLESELGEALTTLVHDASTRETLSRAGRTAVDGLGAARVTAALSALSSSSLDRGVHLRPASPDDAYEVWRIANDPAVRARSFRKAPIDLAEHLEWFSARLRDAASRFWVLDVGGIVAGQVRYAKSGDTAEVHYSVRGAFRGKGLGTLALASSRELACRELRVKRLTGVVITPNEASERSFLSAGWAKRSVERRDEQDCAVYEASCS